MRDRDEIVQTAKAIVKQLQPLTSDDTVDMLLQRLHDAKRGFPTGGEPPAAADEIPDPFNLNADELGSLTPWRPTMADLTNAGVFSSETDTWETPDDVFAPLHAEFGFDLDAAASDDNAKCERYFTPADDALAQDWTGTVWCNPPYGRQIGRWVEKGYVEAQAGATVVMLIPARTDTAYWHDFVMKANEVRFRRGRIYFEMNGKPVGRAPFPSAVIVFRDALEADDGA